MRTEIDPLSDLVRNSDLGMMIDSYAQSEFVEECQTLNTGDKVVRRTKALEKIGPGSKAGASRSNFAVFLSVFSRGWSLLPDYVLCADWLFYDVSLPRSSRHSYTSCRGVYSRSPISLGHPPWLGFLVRDMIFV